MPKLKTKKTLLKRVKVTKTGKIKKKQSNVGHLKAKWSCNRSMRKKRPQIQKNRGHIKLFRRLLGKAGKGIK